MYCLILSPFLFALTLGAPQYSLPSPSNPLQPNNGGSGGFNGIFDSGTNGGFLGGASDGFNGVSNGGFNGGFNGGVSSNTNGGLTNNGGFNGGVSSNTNGGLINNGGFNGGVSSNTNGGMINNIGSSSVGDVPCPEEQVRQIDGNCYTPEITRNVFVYAAPENAVDLGPAPELPKPKVEYNIVFVRTPEFIEGADPIVVPPPQKKTLVYVLSQKQILGSQQVIEVPSGPIENPEVFYVNYNEGENPELPGGINLQDALNAAAATGTVIGGDLTEVVDAERVSEPVEGSAVTVNGAVNGGVTGGVGGGFTNPILNRPSRPSNLYSSP